MAAYFSEVGYQDAPPNFFEVAVPAGTDVSGYSIAIYNGSGVLQTTMSFPAPDGTLQGQDIYTFDEFNPGGVEYGASEAIALIDDTGTVVQFVSFEGKTVSPTFGPAAGETSSSLGFLNSGETFETTDDGSSYYAQSSPSRGTIPCYAPGTLIETPTGPCRIETLRVGDLVTTLDNGPMPIRWTNASEEPLEDPKSDARPILIRAGALGPNRPSRDLIVSPQHRIVGGMAGQLEGFSATEVFVPAKALTCAPGIRFMRGKRKIIWHHFLLDHHAIVLAENCWTESLLLGPMALGGLERAKRRELRFASTQTLREPQPARPCLRVQTAIRMASDWRSLNAMHLSAA